MGPELAKSIKKCIMPCAAERLKRVGLDQRLESGNPEIAEKDFDTIVMGNTGHRSVDQFFLGSVNDHVAALERFGPNRKMRLDLARMLVHRFFWNVASNQIVL